MSDSLLVDAHPDEPDPGTIAQRSAMSVPRLLCRSRDGVAVTYDPVGSHAATHFADTPGLLEATALVLGRMSIVGGPRVNTSDAGYIVGTSDLVPIRSGDRIVYAQRTGRDVYSVFNCSRDPWPCSLVTTVLEEPDEKGARLLRTAWVGTAAPPFPGDQCSSPESLDFWSQNALAWGNQQVRPGTVTTVCPW
ncbi:hypothetical protein [Nocardia salmonicida]|uniref:hypothetical protein n=1 Tax=Nocardia salmonicida TaxID=53431 RepID=UPI0007A431A4|nr:hypothetical protein [Nocardia salmonicida]MBC7299429.1 hypothetical protein [Nocardia sp.]